MPPTCRDPILGKLPCRDLRGGCEEKELHKVGGGGGCGPDS